MTKTALIVDDSRLACKIMANMLDTMNISSVSVYSAEEAIEYLKHTLPDMLFLDHSMPGMSGLETIKLLKSNPHTATVPVLMYTAKEGEVYVGQARALGAVDVLPKGMEKDHLVKALSKLGFVSLDDDVVVKDEQTPKKFIDRRKVPLSDDEHPIQKDDPEWKLFWQSRVEPFLNRQKKQQSDEIRFSTGRQTVKLTREIHQTLEQFEHALIARLAAHDEFKNVKMELEQKHFRKVTYAAVFIGLIMISGLYLQLNKNHMLTEQLQQLQLQQQESNKQILQRLDTIDQTVLANQVTADTDADSTAQSEPDNTAQSSTGQQSVSLVDIYGTIVASNLTLSDTANGEYFGTTSSGFQFIVNLEGKVGWPLDTLYFTSSDCTGNAHINSDTGRIYRNDKDEIWYVDKLAVIRDIKVESSLNALNECSVGTDEQLNLRLIERDFNMITGIDDSQTMSLYFD